MKVLWLCNILLPAIAGTVGLPYSNREGWLSGTYQKLCEERKSRQAKGKSAEAELAVCFPVSEKDWQHISQTELQPRHAGKSFASEKSFVMEESGVVCYPFIENLAAPEIYEESLEGRFHEILEDYQPDIVHIFGTEFPHTLAMVRAFDRPERTLIGIQGLCFACAEEYLANLPERVIRRRTFRDIVKKDSILQQQEKFRVRGEREKEALKRSGHITGRTDFDRKRTAQVQPQAVYHFMNETMREPFYTDSWEAEKCVPYRIFLSQGDYPLKGFHYVLQAMQILLQEFPKACVCVAGNSIMDARTLKDRLKISSYGKYLRELVRENHLEEHVKVLGRLSAGEMKEEYLKSSVFICPSALENSPNSMGEAMLLGVPVVAADTGGIPSMIEDEKEGLLYPPKDVDKLAQAVARVWKEPQETKKRAQTARERALCTHDKDKNYQQLLRIYREICQ